MLPPEPQREEAAFTGWSADTSNVQQDMDVLALYDGLSDKVTVNVIARRERYRRSARRDGLLL